MPKTLKPEGFERHVVLVSPDVHWNTGNIGRTCLGTGAHLHLIEPLGFSLDDKHLKRAGLDYWHRVSSSVWHTFDAFIDSMKPARGEIVVFSKNGGRPCWEMPSPEKLFLIFGSETHGLPGPLLTRFSDVRFHIPITREIRSLNLSTAVGIALYESIRNFPDFHGYQ